MKHIISTALAALAFVATAATLTVKDGLTQYNAPGQIASVRAITPEASTNVTVREVEEWFGYGEITTYTTNTAFRSWTCVWTNRVTHALSTNDITRAPIIPPVDCMILSFVTNYTTTITTNVRVGVTASGLVTNDLFTIGVNGHMGNFCPTNAFLFGSGRILVDGLGNGGTASIIVK